MSGQEKRDLKNKIHFTYPVLAAQKFIQLFEQVTRPSEEQRAILAAAYYTLSTQKNISRNRSKMHVNAAIALLKNINIKERKENWGSQIARAYFKRAELLEENNAYSEASQDYRAVIQALDNNQPSLVIDDEDRLLLAQSAISIADLIVNEEINDSEVLSLSHPLFYINKALEHLAGAKEVDDDMWATQAYAHQIAGIALGPRHFEEAVEAFRVALSMAFKTENVRICPLLSDIYTCLGLLFEERYQSCPIEYASESLFDHAMIYFGLSLLFTPSEMEEGESDIMVLESLFEMIYRVLDPYLSPLSVKLNCDLVDALIYAYMCMVDKALPNQALANQLSKASALDTYAQHIYWLVIEAYHRKNPDANLLDITNPENVDLKLNVGHTLNILQNQVSNNVYYLEKNRPAYSV